MNNNLCPIVFENFMYHCETDTKYNNRGFKEGRQFDTTVAAITNNIYKLLPFVELI